jgi:alanine racemase
MQPHGPTLEVNLSALIHNYRLLKEQHAKNHIGAVVKANAYGLGVEAVAKALWKEGCRDFFVATLAEGVQLRNILPDCAIGVFNGVMIGEERDFLHHRLAPVLNDLGQVSRFAGKGAAILHIDTGMTRLGLCESEVGELISRHPGYHKYFTLIMSHLACANEPGHPKNAEQLVRFQSITKLFSGTPASLANSSGLFLSSDFHFDLGRPGCALYGINPVMGVNPMHHVATLSAPILQIRSLVCDETVGYGASYPIRQGGRLAIAGIGYADGVLRYLSNKGSIYIGKHKAPIAGRVSMDMIAIDVSAIPENELTHSTRIEFINATQTVGDVAAACSTIGYEIFTRIGQRVTRTYVK